MKAALVVSAIFCFYFAIIYLIGRRKWSRMAATLLARRPNPTQGEFVSFLAPDVGPETAEWFWNELHVYFRPTLTPHPDDDLMSDLPIDGDEPDDWVQEYCKRNGLSLRQLGKWPDRRPVTPRNLLGWLESERRRLTTN